MSSHMTLGQKIRAARKQLNMTQQDLAGDEFTKSFISQLEKDVAKPSLKSLQVIARRLNKPVSYFLEEAPSNTVPHLSDKVFHLLTLGQRLEANKLPQDALEYYQQALQELPPDSHLLRAKVLYLIARAAARAQNLALAIENYKEAASEFAAVHDLHSQARAQILAGQLLLKSGDLKEAEELLGEGYRNLDGCEPDVYFWQIQAQSSLGDIYKQLNQPERALSCYFDSLEISIIHGITVNYGKINREIGLLHLEKKEFAEAERYLQQARHYYFATGNEQNAARCTIHLAKVYLSQGRIDIARTLAQEGLDRLQAWAYPREAYTAYTILGETAEETKDYSDAIAYFQSAREYAKNPQELAALEMGIARILRYQGLVERSIEHLLGLEQWIQTAAAPALQAAFYSELAESYSTLAETGKAQEYMKKSLDIYRKLQG